jgi:chemotaxis signal transduction protein
VTTRRDAAPRLAERARLLALPEEGIEEVATRPLACFAIAGQAFGVPLEFVVRAAALRHLTEAPGAPPWLLGVAGVEGRLVATVELAGLYGVGRQEMGILGGVLVVGGAGGRELGLAAERLVGIRDVHASSIRPLPGAPAPLARMAIDELLELLVVDVPALLADPRLDGGG